MSNVKRVILGFLGVVAIVAALAAGLGVSLAVDGGSGRPRVVHLDVRGGSEASEPTTTVAPVTAPTPSVAQPAPPAPESPAPVLGRSVAQPEAGVGVPVADPDPAPAPEPTPPSVSTPAPPTPTVCVPKPRPQNPPPGWVPEYVCS